MARGPGPPGPGVHAAAHDRGPAGSESSSLAGGGGRWWSVSSPMSPGETPAREGEAALGGASPVALDSPDALGGLGPGTLGECRTTSVEAPVTCAPHSSRHPGQPGQPRAPWSYSGNGQDSAGAPALHKPRVLRAQPRACTALRPRAEWRWAAARPRWSSSWSTCGTSDPRHPCHLGRHQGLFPEKHTVGAGHVAGAPTESESETVQGAGLGSVHRRPRGLPVTPSPEGLPSRIPSVVASAPILRVPGACRVRH